MSDTPTPTPAPADPIKGGLLNRILNLTQPASAPAPDPVKPADAAPAPAPAAPDPAKPADTKPAEPTPAPKPPVKVVKREKPVTKKDLEDLLKKPDPAPAPTPDPAVKPTGPNTDGLVEEEIKEVEIAAFAEKKDPKLAGLGGKLADFYRARNAEMERRQAEDPDFDPSSDVDFRQWLKKNQPSFSRAQRDTFRELKIKDETVAEVDARYQKDMAALRKELTEVKVKPAIEQRVSSLERETLDALDGDLGAAVKEAGGDMKKLAETHPLEAEVIGKTLRGAQRIAREYLLIQNGAKDLDAADPVHGYLREFITDASEQMASASEDESTRDGKTFISPDKFDPAKMGSTHWTFETEDIVAMLRASALREATEEIARRDAEAARLGYARKPKAPPASATPAVPTPPTQAAVPPAATRPSGGPVPATPPANGTLLQRLLGLPPVGNS